MKSQRVLKTSASAVIAVALSACLCFALAGCGETSSTTSSSTDVTSKLVKCENVGAVATAVATGDAEAGIVYSSDLIKYQGQGLKQCCNITSLCDEIEYQGAVMTFSGTKTKAAQDFLTWLNDTSGAQKIFTDYGFYTKSEKSDKASTKTDNTKAALTIFNANSTSDALSAAEKEYQKTHPNITFTNNPQASGKLLESMKAGETCDIFISASSATMTQAVDAGYTTKANVIDMYTNDLIVVANASNASKFTAIGDLTKASKIAIGDPATVPAGKYATQALQAAKLLPAS